MPQPREAATTLGAIWGQRSGTERNTDRI